MKRHWTIGLCALGLAGLFFNSAMGQEKEEKADDNSPAALFEKLDANKDGKLTKDEVGEQRARFFNRLLRVADKNEDGVLTKEEFIAGNQPAQRPAQPQNNFPGRRFQRGGFPGGPNMFSDEAFKRLDANNDGKVTLAEVSSDREKNIVRMVLRRAGKGEDRALTKEDFRRPGGQPGMGFGGPPPILRALDADRDGKISKEELAKAGEKFSELDRDKDGSLDPRELFGFNPGPRPEGNRPGQFNREGFAAGLIQRYDANKDGKLSGDEIPERGKERFMAWDKNKDGELTKEEITEGSRTAPDRPRRGNDRPRRPSRPNSDK